MSRPIQIAFLLDFFPFPENRDGATKIIGNILNRLDPKKFQITIIQIGQSPEKGELELLADHFTYYHHQFKAKGTHPFMNKLKFLPINALNKGQINELNTTYKLNQFDIIHCSVLSFVLIGKEKLKAVTSINDSVSRTYKAITLKGKLKRWYYKKMEQKISKLNKNLIVVSKLDAAEYQYSRCFVMVNGVDTKIFKPRSTEQKKPGFVFHGILDYHVNISSIEYMSNLIKKAGVETKLHLVGRMNRPNKDVVIAQFNELKNCELIGEVEDISAAISQFEVYLCLMDSGAGIKNKLLESMASRMVVFTNSKGIEGLIHHDEVKKAVYIIENEQDLQLAIHDNDNWGNKSRLAYEYTIKHYSWDKYIQQLVACYEKVLAD